MQCMVAMAWLAAAAVAPAQVKKAPPAHPDAGSVEVHLGQGYDALKQDRYEVARDEFRAALRLDPKLVLKARFPLAVALFELHQWDDARKEFATVQRQAGTHPNVNYYLGRLDLEGGAFPGAIQNLKQAIAQPPFPDTAYYLGFACLKQGDLPEAEKWLKRAGQDLPADARVPYQLGVLYRKQGRSDEAQQATQRSEDMRHREDEQSKLRGECGRKLEQSPGAEAHAVCEQLFDVDNAESLTELGTIYAQHGDLPAALKPLQRAAELTPQSPQMQYNLALAYFQSNRLEEARKPLARAIERWPDLFPLNALYGTVLAKLGEPAQAYSYLEHAHRLNPQDHPTADLFYATTLALAYQSGARQRYAESTRWFAAAAKLRPEDPEPHQGLAEVYQARGQATLAAAERQKAEQLKGLRKK